MSMPRRRNKMRRRRNRLRVGRRGGGLVGGESQGFESSLIAQRTSPLQASLHELMRAVTVPVEEKGGWLNIGKKGDEKDPEPIVKLRLLRAIFKADHPFRTRVSLAQTVGTPASGVLNFQYQISNIASAAEWGSIDALFDECFVHSMTMHYSPANKCVSSGYGATSSAAVGLETSTTAAPTLAFNSGLVVCSLFSVAGFYSGATGITNNPTCAFKHSAEPFKYVWRNQVKFLPHGDSLTPSSSSQGWAGWISVTSAANLSGAIQMRTFADLPLGDQTHNWTLGNAAIIFDVSFRSRA